MGIPFTGTNFLFSPEKSIDFVEAGEVTDKVVRAARRTFTLFLEVAAFKQPLISDNRCSHWPVFMSAGAD